MYIKYECSICHTIAYYKYVCCMKSVYVDCQISIDLYYSFPVRIW